MKGRWKQWRYQGEPPMVNQPWSWKVLRTKNHMPVERFLNTLKLPEEGWAVFSVDVLNGWIVLCRPRHQSADTQETNGGEFDDC
jgi:hypothetical protein